MLVALLGEDGGALLLVDLVIVGRSSGMSLSMAM
jgi:hypothetical protein